jgi:hypothetical protein
MKAELPLTPVFDHASMRTADPTPALDTTGCTDTVADATRRAVIHL